MRKFINLLFYLVFLLIFALFVSNCFSQNQNLQSEKKTVPFIDDIVNLLARGKLEKAINEIYQFSNKDSETTLIVLSEKSEVLEDMHIKRSSVAIGPPVVDSTKSPMIRTIKCRRASVINKLEFYFEEQSIKKINPNIIQLALWPGHLIVVYIKEKDVFNFYPEVNYYNFKRKSTSLLGIRLSAVTFFGSLAFYDIRRFSIDEKNYENYLNAQTPAEANRLKNKCNDGRKITQIAGGFAIVSGAVFGYFFGRDLLLPWIFGKERLLASNAATPNKPLKFAVQPQIGYQEAIINISYRF